MNNFQMLQQIMKAPNQLSMLKSLVGNNNQAMQMMSQIQMLTPEQQAEKIADMCNQNGITLNDLKGLLGLQ